MTRLVIDGRRYDLGALERASLRQLMVIDRETGMGIGDVLGALQGLQDAEDPAQALSGRTLLAIAVMVWLARDTAGDRAPDGTRLTVEQAADFPLSGLRVEDGEGDRPGPPR